MNQRLKKVTQYRDAILNSLVKLALPAVEQVKVIKNEDYIQELVLDYKDVIRDWSNSTEYENEDLHKISIDIRLIDRFLERFHDSRNDHYWSFDALESHDDWDKVRKMSRQALEKLNISYSQQGFSWN